MGVALVRTVARQIRRPPGTVQPHASALCGKKPIIAFSFSKDRLRVVMPRLLSVWKKPLRKDSFVALRADGTAGMVL
jgi:hypothetical protein